MSPENLNVTLEFSGGAELLFGNKKKHQVVLKSAEQEEACEFLISKILIFN